MPNAFEIPGSPIQDSGLAAIDILFINPAHHGPDYYSPIGINMLTTIVRDKGRTSDVLDFQRMVIGREIAWPEGFLVEAEMRLQEVRARIFGFTVMNVGFPWALELAAVVRRLHPQATIVFGGPHATLLAREILETSPQVDVVMVNEGEQAILPFIEAVLEERSLSDCPNLLFREADGTIVRTRATALLDDLDGLPWMTLDRDLLTRSAMISVEAGRGCPYRCKFCSSHAIWTRTPRFKSPSRLVNEAAAYVAQAGSRAEPLLISLEHDDLISNRPWFRDFVSFKQEVGADFRYAITTRINHLTEEVVSLLASSGCVSVFVGLESGSERVQTSSWKHLDLRKLVPSLRGLRESRIHFSSNFIVGFPNETMEDVAATIELVLRMAWLGSTVNISMLCPEPGSEIHADADPADYRLILEGDYAAELRRGGLSPESLHPIARYHLTTLSNPNFDVLQMERTVRSIQYLITTFPGLTFEVFEAFSGNAYAFLTFVWNAVLENGPIDKDNVPNFAQAAPRRRTGRSSEFFIYENARAGIRRGELLHITPKAFQPDMPDPYFAWMNDIADAQWMHLNANT
ncbi:MULTISPECIES: B12-binding domain-containing radical SAM protein [unclassified Bradyrhizobium]|uniref:B12-binding domain-containing radical SAM protein n=1 Tax=unclassified Bradyrhizobium TaxID=2631580 RepID=UPI002917051A|nr:MULTISPECIES: radical SAM protein [unclassified Bradyrhizobium]